MVSASYGDENDHDSYHVVLQGHDVVSIQSRRTIELSLVMSNKGGYRSWDPSL